MERGKCEFHGREHAEGTELCDAARCMVCKDGKWRTTWISPFGP